MKISPVAFGVHTVLTQQVWEEVQCSFKSNARLNVVLIGGTVRQLQMMNAGCVVHFTLVLIKDFNKTVWRNTVVSLH